MTNDEIEIALDVAKTYLTKEKLYNTLIIYAADENDNVCILDLRGDMIGLKLATGDIINQGMQKFAGQKYPPSMLSD